MKNREVADALRRLADSMELLGEDRYRVANYRDAATRVEHHHEPIEVMAAEGRVEQIHGVGKSIGAKIVEYLETGTLQAIEERRPRVPEAALRLMQIPGIGPRRAMAVRRGLTLNEYGVFAGDDARNLASRTEDEVYAAVGLPWIPPELRDGAGELELARQGRLPRLVELADIKGDVHLHPRLTDGSSTIAEMVRAGSDRGYAYLAITDHSQALGVTGGLTEDELRVEHEQTRALRPAYPSMDLLCGVEVDIHVDERLDCSDAFLAECDLVVASIHSALQKPRGVQTSRLIAAINNPHVDVIAHPTGRLLGKRPGYEIDLPAVLDALARTGTAIEVSGQPVLNTDAHAADQVGELMRYAVGAARRGGATREAVLNARDAAGLWR